MAQLHDFTQVNFAQMQAAQEGLIKVVTELDRITDQLYRDVANTLKDAWYDDETGTGAKSEFDAARVVWDAQEKEMGNQLAQAAQAVGLANQNYMNAERAARALWADPGR
ncbi:hypothetical protein ACGF0J_01355 [Nonomuraea sp. NPDC047897]|jgi:hypothetical protein|uniref:hypothetical protein n=1 Tax=Nonomuraea sp. NPDC047897 TaxID=3364346 RepID=UPI0037236A8B